LAHVLHDVMQSVLVALYPLLKTELHLSYGQIGGITLAFQLTASILQPAVGWATDRRAWPWALPACMGLTLLGLAVLSRAPSLQWVLVAAVLIGLGSALFHPEASRVIRQAAGPRPGWAQSLFQIGGNLGSALGPLCAAGWILPRGQAQVLWMALGAVLGMAILQGVSRWVARHGGHARRRVSAHAMPPGPPAVVARSLGLLGVLMVSKFFYMASFSNYYSFYLMARFGLSAPDAQLHLFVFLMAVAVGTVLGGSVGDRWGRKAVIQGSILGVLPLSLALPHAPLWGTALLSVGIGLILSSAFSAILVYAQELLPGRVGLVSGLFFGLAFGLGGLGARNRLELRCRRTEAVMVHLPRIENHVNRTVSRIVQVDLKHAPASPKRMHNPSADCPFETRVGL
jgi:FSR family fosmidomycin resistance protein-like MFS transporter